MFKNATARRIARAQRNVIAIVADLGDEQGTVFRPAKRPHRGHVKQAAIRASQMGLTV
ncbi:hypothetical protein QQG74_09270 [Micromonospora sp. FIMYZ51]|uniref:hypothetical protein n=1 Tax=Micromonospora sp. FIMYZ51 TaxID=3051832 RepID=UPI00312048CD